MRPKCAQKPRRVRRWRQAARRVSSMRSWLGGTAVASSAGSLVGASRTTPSAPAASSAVSAAAPANVAVHPSPSSARCAGTVVSSWPSAPTRLVSAVSSAARAGSNQVWATRRTLTNTNASPMPISARPLRPAASVPLRAKIASPTALAAMPAASEGGGRVRAGADPVGGQAHGYLQREVDAELHRGERRQRAGADVVAALGLEGGDAEDHPVEHGDEVQAGGEPPHGPPR